MSVGQRLREPAALIAAGTFGGVVGTLAAVRGPSPWLGPLAGLGSTALLLVVHVLSGMLIDRHHTWKQPVQWEASIAGTLAMIFALAGGVLTAMRMDAYWLGFPVGLAIFVGLLALNATAGRVADRTRWPAPAPPPPNESLQEPALLIEPQPRLESELDLKPDTPKSLAVVFIHGLLSSPKVWTAFRELIEADQDLAALEIRTFQYSSPFLRLNPLKRIPDFDMIAGKLRTYLEDDLGEFPSIVLVTHSQGGLVAQRFLARMLNNGRGRDLARIKRLIMFACPNSGSEVALTLRRLAWFWRHPQEQQLRPLNVQITEAHRIVINQVIHAKRNTPQKCPIAISVYAGEEDNVVTSTSAFSVLPEDQTGVLPGDHFSIIRPDSQTDSAYLTLRKKLLTVLHENAASRTP